MTDASYKPQLWRDTSTPPPRPVWREQLRRAHSLRDQLMYALRSRLYSNLRSARLHSDPDARGDARRRALAWGQCCGVFLCVWHRPEFFALARRPPYETRPPATDPLVSAGLAVAIDVARFNSLALYEHPQLAFVLHFADEMRERADLYPSSHTPERSAYTLAVDEAHAAVNACLRGTLWGALDIDDGAACEVV